MIKHPLFRLLLVILSVLLTFSVFTQQRCALYYSLLYERSFAYGNDRAQTTSRVCGTFPTCTLLVWLREWNTHVTSYVENAYICICSRHAAFHSIISHFGWEALCFSPLQCNIICMYYLVGVACEANLIDCFTDALDPITPSAKTVVAYWAGETKQTALGLPWYWKDISFDSLVESRQNCTCNLPKNTLSLNIILILFISFINSWQEHLLSHNKS